MATTIFEKSNKRTEYKKAWYEKNREKLKLYKHDWFQKNYKVNKEKMLAQRKKDRLKHQAHYREYERLYRKKNGESLKLKIRRWNNNRRRNIIEFLGGKCIKCGFSDWRALQIDHINSDGYKERKERGGNNLSKFYARIEKDVEERTGKYQLLCSNCNWIKKYESFEGYKGV